MFSEKQKNKFYLAMLDKDIKYKEVFYVAVKTTGIFCISTCSAQKPYFKNCEFYKTIEEVLLASFRPCKRCFPLFRKGNSLDEIKIIIELIENNPVKNWHYGDFHKNLPSITKACNDFKETFHLTFLEYAKARRIGIAMKQVRYNGPVINLRLEQNCLVNKFLKDIFSDTLGNIPISNNNHYNILKIAWITTPLGPMVAIADQKALFLLEFIDRKNLENEIKNLRIKTRSAIIPGITKPITSIQQELVLYFNKKLRSFQTNIQQIGTFFQKQAWQALIKIPYGKTKSYADQAKFINNSKAYRAVASANSFNQLAIIVPCHRVVGSNGKLVGYAAKLWRKKWLIEHERVPSSGVVA